VNEMEWIADLNTKVAMLTSYIISKHTVHAYYLHHQPGLRMSPLLQILRVVTEIHTHARKRASILYQ
jgi:hypothetical protein